MDHWDENRLDIGPPGVGGFYNEYIFFRVIHVDWVQLMERQYRAKPLHVHGETESSRPFGPLWYPHLPVLIPTTVQVLILEFVFHSEDSMRSMVRQDYENNWAEIWEEILNSEEPTGPFLEY